MTRYDYATIPPELQALNQWVLWQRTGEGKVDKIPYQPNGHKAQSNNPKTWTSFNHALDVYLRGHFAGN